MRRQSSRGWFHLALAAAALVAVASTHARAGCDNIPTEIDEFRAAEGTITAPFATPGQLLQVRVRPEVCDGTSLGLGTAPACLSDDAVRVTILFEPGGGAPVNAVVLARSCGDSSNPASLAARVAQWAAALGPRGSAVCQAQPALDVFAADLGTISECRLSFEFPTATGPTVALPNTLTGPTRIVVEPAASPLPTDLVGRRCADAVATKDTIACIDELFRIDGSCFVEAENANRRFPSFTALPVPNDFAAMAGADRPSLRFALDAAGNVLAPMDWSGVLCQTDEDCPFEGFPPPQLVEVVLQDSIGRGLDAGGAPSVPGSALAVPNAELTASLTLQGTELPPIFDPAATTGSASDAVSLFGSTDAVKTVIRLQVEAPGRCSIDQVPCVTDAGCSSVAGAQTCDLDAADVRIADLGYCRHPGACQAPGSGGSAATPSGGPALVPAALYEANTDGFVLLETLNACRESDQLTCLLRDEAVAGVDKNDGDLLDPAVLTLRDKLTGEKLRLGLDGQSEGLATALLHESPAAVGPFGQPVLPAPLAASVRPTAGADDGCAALLLAEPWENGASQSGVDANADGEAFDPVLRVFCRAPGAPGGIEEVAADAAVAAGLGPSLGASAAPRILASPRTASALQGGGEPLVHADGRLYFLLDEAANALRAPDQRVDLDSLGLPGNVPPSEPILSAGGTVACFASNADLALSRDKNQDGPDVYCRDLATGTTDVVNRFQEKPRRGPLCGGRVIRANQAAVGTSLSDDGRRVCYESAASNLLAGGTDKNKVADVYLYERGTCETVRVSLTSGGTESPNPSGACSVAGKGTHVAFASAGRLVATDSDATGDVYVTPLTGGTDASRDPLRVGAPVLASGGLTGSAGAPSLSGDGRRVAFELVTPAGTRVVVRDLANGTATDPLGFDLAGARPSLSADGRLLTLESVNPLTGRPEVFAIDLSVSALRGAPIGAPVAQTASLEDVMAESFDGSASPAAVAFTSPAPLVPGDAGVDADVHVRDLVTRLVKRVGDGASSSSLSSDGGSVAYVAPVGAGRGAFRHGPVLGNQADVDGNGSPRDTVLAVLDLASSSPQLALAGAARQVAVAGPNAALLAPEGQLSLRTCSANRTCSQKAMRAPGSNATALASAVAVSESAVCALLASTSRLACAPVGASQLVDLGFSAQALGMTGDFVVAVTSARPAALRAFRLQSGGFAPVFTGAPGTRRFVLSQNAFAAYDRCETDAGADLNGDGLEDECVLNLVDLATARLLETSATVLPCTLEACDRRFPWRVFPSGELQESATLRFLTLECQEDGSCAGCGGGSCPPAGRSCDLNLDGGCDDVVVREIASNRREFVLAELFGDPSAIQADPLAGIASGGSFNQGAVFPALVGRCDVDDDPATEPTTQPCQSDASCPDGLVCGPPFSVLALNDADGDGIFDGFDNCPDTFNPEQGDGDADRAGDACDLFTCGDGALDTREFCDDGVRNGSCEGLTFDACKALGAAGSFCDDLCRPEVFVDVSESAVNPGKSGLLPSRIYGTPYLNLGPARPFDGTRCAIAGGCPAEMIDLASVALEGVRSGTACSGTGAPLGNTNLGDFNSDGIPDIQSGFAVEQAKIELGDDEACLTGDFRPIEDRFRNASFEARDHLNVK